MKEKKIIVNQIRTPDGTILVSRHRHDYVTYTDKNGLEYMVDGGTDYLRRNTHDSAPYEELTIWEDSPFEVIREHYCRGGRGKDGAQPLTWVPLSKMSNSWLEACIEYNTKLGLAESTPSELYAKELDYRKAINLYIKD